LAGDAEVLLGGGCELAIQDQSGLLPVNALVGADGQYNETVRQSFVRLLVAAGGVGADDAENIVDAVKDWLDADDEVTRFGAESATYLAMAQPYRCRNAPIASLDELLLVQGMSAELLYGAEGSPGIASSLTVYGRDGVVNINTAPTAVLMALAENMDMEMAEAMDEYRQDPANDLSSPTWYRNIRGDVNLVGAVVKSEYFEIVATGVEGRMRRTVRGVVRRHDAKKIEVLSWQVD
ncbi:MAG: general secretion pathway protein GspK, partial [Desulfobulbaceae bacterium]|nr:general secretion pathway protein GspK [Desulfobulbaceae bacterium]